MANENKKLINIDLLSKFKTKQDAFNAETYATKEDISTAYRYKGSVDNYADLPSTDLTVGDIYNITNADTANNIKAGDNVAWNGTAWDNLSGITDLSNFVEKETGKGLSTNDFTDEYKGKLDGVSTEANKTTVTAETMTAGTKIGTVSIDGTDTDLYAPAVTVTSTNTTGAKIATVSVNGVDTDIYAAANDYEMATTDDIDALFA